MLDTFKARLTAKMKAAGVNLSKKRIDAYADRLHKKNPDVKEESEHDTLIDDLDEIVSFADVAKDDDRDRANQEKIKKLSQKPAPSKKDEEPDDEEEDEEEETDESKTKDKKKQAKDSGRMPKWAKGLFEKVDALMGEKSQATIKSLIADKLKGEDGKPKVPEKFYSKWKLPEKEDQIEDFVAQVETDWTEINPAGTETPTETKPAGGHKPNRGGQKVDKVSDKDVDLVMDRIMPVVKQKN